MIATYSKYILDFKQPAGTSRGVLQSKETWFLKIVSNGKVGIGECGLLRGLSIDDRPDYEEKLQWLCEHIHLDVNHLLSNLIEFPSIQFGLEMALLSLKNDEPFMFFPSEFTDSKKSIPINGLIWMNDKENMKTQIEEKIKMGFNCIKLKVGAIDFDEELALLSYIRQHFDANAIEIRLDANGAFSPETALHKLEQLSEYEIHSIEQPIQKNNLDCMKKLCELSKIPIALDEELIGIFDIKAKENLLTKVKPKYIILKPSFVGGFSGTLEWIKLAEKHKIGWWITSALESNVGLNAIAQFTFTLQNDLPQGLGTGSLYLNNFDSQLVIKNGNLWFDKNKSFNFEYFNNDFFNTN